MRNYLFGVGVMIILVIGAFYEGKSVADSWWQQHPTEMPIRMRVEPPNAPPDSIAFYVGGGLQDGYDGTLDGGTKIGVKIVDYDLAKSGWIVQDVAVDTGMRTISGTPNERLANRRTDWLERQLKYRQHEIDVLAECRYQTSPPKTAWCARELEKVDTDKRGMRYEAEAFGWPEGKP